MSASVLQGRRDLLLSNDRPHDVVQWLDAEGNVHSAPASPALMHEDLLSGLPVRVGAEYQNRPNRHGLYVWTKTGEFVWFESGLEMESLFALDFRGDIAAVASQPLRILFAADSPCTRHDPDFLAVRSDGTIVLIDVKPSHRIADSVIAQFDETARVCAAIGWEYDVMIEPDATTSLNLDVLRAARHRRNHPAGPMHEQTLAAFDTPRTFIEGCRILSPRVPELVMGHVRHLLWHRHLMTDLSKPLGFNSVIESTTRGHRCCDEL